MVEPCELIILHHTPYSEKSVVIHTLSQQWGRRSFLVKNGGKYINFFQPLNILDCEVNDNSRSTLATASSFSSASALSGIRNSLGRNAISIFMAEVLFRAVPEDGQERGLYEWFRQEIMILEALPQDYANFHVRFLLDFASALGFSPSLDVLRPFVNEYSPLVKTFLESDIAGSMMIRLNGQQRAELCSRLLKYLEFHLETRLNIRSLGVLSELF